ncbi:hypothetical protein [Spirosoma validum]|uniref:Porin family protein n=1 Tax=Spirosoma validum TaxID=2771355 RepID=A0A927GCX6_9BACT|nr:hypothetical protein [Spirosoma validum]MBD2753083.1 hypothetical protein [Spirosoma validum]
MIMSIKKEFITLSLLSILLVVSASSRAQQNKFLLNAGIITGQENAGFGAAGQYFLTRGLSVGAQYYAIQEKDVLTVNANVLTGEATASFIGLRGDFHINTLFANLTERLDPYLGLSAGKIFIAGTTQLNSGPIVNEHYSYNGLTVFAPVGVRYWFGHHVGAFAEYNIGLANVTADINGDGKRESFYEKRQYLVGVGLSVRF